jgi:hypothetical protein
MKRALDEPPTSACRPLFLYSDVEAILDAHYLGRDIHFAEAAVLKLEARTKL